MATLAKESLLKVCGAIGNSDIEPFIPAVVSAIANPTEVTDCVYKLAGTTFVQVVAQTLFPPLSDAKPRPKFRRSQNHIFLIISPFYGNQS